MRVALKVLAALLFLLAALGVTLGWVPSALSMVALGLAASAVADLV